MSQPIELHLLRTEEFCQANMLKFSKDCLRRHRISVEVSDLPQKIKEMLAHTGRCTGAYTKHLLGFDAHDGVVRCVSPSDAIFGSSLERIQCDSQDRVEVFLAIFKSLEAATKKADLQNMAKKTVCHGTGCHITGSSPALGT